MKNTAILIVTLLFLIVSTGPTIVEGGTNSAEDYDFQGLLLYQNHLKYIKEDAKNDSNCKSSYTKCATHAIDGNSGSWCACALDCTHKNNKQLSGKSGGQGGYAYVSGGKKICLDKKKYYSKRASTNH